MWKPLPGGYGRKPTDDQKVASSYHGTEYYMGRSVKLFKCCLKIPTIIDKEVVDGPFQT